MAHLRIESSCRSEFYFTETVNSKYNFDQLTNSETESGTFRRRKRVPLTRVSLRLKGRFVAELPQVMVVHLSVES